MVTMQDVARRANVSTATVSFVVNNTKSLPPETVARVERAMDELGYRRNELARALASKRSRIIALLLPVAERSMGGTAFRFLASAAGRSHERGYTLVVWPISEEAEDFAELTGSALIEGVVVMEVYLDDQRIPLLQRAGLPFTLIGRTRSAAKLPYVDVDFERTLADAVGRLTDLGHESIVLVVGPPSESGFGPRERSIEQFVKTGHARGRRTHVFEVSEGAGGRSELAATMLEQIPDATAVLIEHETAAAALVNGLRRLGKRIPEDISVALTVSSDDFATTTEPALSLWRTPTDELGREAVDALIDQLEGLESPPVHGLIGCEFVDRGTLAHANARRAN